MDNKKSYITTESVKRILHYTLPKLNRCLNEDHIKDMVEDQIAEYNKFNCFSLLQSITVGSLDEQFFVLDGQHRIKTFEILMKNGYCIGDLQIPVVIYKLQNKDELMSYFQRINKNMPIHPLELEYNYEDWGKTFCNFITKHFKIYLKNDKCRCPHINMNELKTNILARNNLYNYDVNVFCETILQINDYISTSISSNTQLCSQSKKRLEDCEKKADKSNCCVCYLGVWRHYEWLDLALYLLSSKKQLFEINISEFSKEKRQHIPFVVREQVWKKNNLNISDSGLCFVCNSDLRFPDMECGHILAHCLGGNTNLDNLMPICKSCNRDMGIMNLFDYKQMCSGGL